MSPMLPRRIARQRRPSPFPRQEPAPELDRRQTDDFGGRPGVTAAHGPAFQLGAAPPELLMEPPPLAAGMNYGAAATAAATVESPGPSGFDGPAARPDEAVAANGATAPAADARPEFPNAALPPAGAPTPLASPAPQPEPAVVARGAVHAAAVAAAEQAAAVAVDAAATLPDTDGGRTAAPESTELAGIAGQTPEAAASAEREPLPFENELEPLVRSLPEPVDPLERPPAGPLSTPEIRVAFEAPPALNANAIVWPAGTERMPEEERQTAVQEAARLLAATVAEIHRQHDASETAAGRATEALALAYDRAREQITADLLRIDDSLTAALERALPVVQAAADRADLVILQNYAGARETLNRAYARGRAAMAHNARTATAQINTIKTNLASGYVTPLTDAATRCNREALEAYNNAVLWQRNIPTRFDDTTGPLLTQAMHEAQRPAAGELVGQLITALETNRTQVVGGFNTSIANIQNNVKTRVEPTLNAHAGAIRTRGMRQLRQAFESALEALQQGANQARRTVEEMRTAHVAQLYARRRAARATLESEAMRAAADVRRAAGTGMQTLELSAQRALPLYADATARLRATLVAAGAHGGPQALTRTAVRAAGSVARTVQSAAQSQVEQAETVREGVVETLAVRPGAAQLAMDAEAAAADADFQPVLAEATLTLAQAAETQTSSFASMAQGVRRTAQYWSTSLDRTFEKFITRHKDQLAEGLSEFLDSVNNNCTNFVNWVTPRKNIETSLRDPLERAWAPARERLVERKNALIRALNYGLIDTVDEGGVTGALRGMTRPQGNGLRQLWLDSQGGWELDLVLAYRLGRYSDDYRAAIHYLNGDRAAGALYELRASIHWYNDEEARIEAVMRSLSDADCALLQGMRGWEETRDTVRDNLGGTDLSVFNALEQGRYARADALRMRDRIREARQAGDQDALNTVLAEYGRKPAPDQFGGQNISAAERRRQVQREFAHIQGVVAVENGGTITEAQAQETLVRFATDPIQVERYAGEGQTYTVTLTVEGAQAHLAEALIRHDEDSVPARVARLGVETQRDGAPNILNLDAALVDPRLNPNNPAITEEERRQAREERQQVLTGFARTYAGAGSSVNADQARAALIIRLRSRHDSGSSGADLAEALVRDDYPSPATASIAMEYAMEGAGTNEELIDRFLGRMNRDEIGAMRTIYNGAGRRNLDADLGVNGRGGLFAELSGDDRLRVERLLLGQPRTDRERAELAIFTMRQQRRETGLVGGLLASGSMAERELEFNERRLAELVGGEVTFGPNGPEWSGNPNFNAEGAFIGREIAEFSATTLGARLSAENYAAAIDNYANFVATTLTIAGAIVATVATGGGASPLLVAAIVGASGLAAMGARRAISGGRYGWEQASVDLGMTAVQALTAGVGQSLSLAARGGMPALQGGLRTGFSLSAARAFGGALPTQLGRLTGSAFLDRVFIGMATGALNSLGQAALSEGTYAKGGGKAFMELFTAAFRGSISGGASGAVAGVLESPARSLMRGASQPLVEFAGGAAGRATELGIDAARGTFRGDAGDILLASVDAGTLSALQNVAESGLQAGMSARPRPRIGPETPGAAEGGAPAPRPAGAAPDSATPPGPGTTPRPAGAAAMPSPTATAQPAPAEPPPSGTRPAAPAVAETAAPPRPAATPAPEAAPTAARPPAESQAAAIPGARFHGEALQRPHPEIHNRVEAAVSDLQRRGPLGVSTRRPSAAPDNVQVRAANGDWVEVQVAMHGPELMRPHTGSPVPVARFSYDPETGQYTVFVSRNAHPDAVARALAHELAEIHATHRAAATPDVLRPGGARPAAGEPTGPLSPHDLGRLAELEVLGRQIASAGSQGDARRLAVLRDEAERLATSLGMTGADEGARLRRSAAVDRLPAGSPGRALIGSAVESAAANPFLQRRPPELAEDLDLMARQLAHARALGDDHLAGQVLELARRRLIAGVEGLVTTPRTAHAGPVISQSSLGALQAAGGPRAALVSEALPLVRRNPRLEPGAPSPVAASSGAPRDPADLDPHQAEAVRRDFGHRSNFQDWPDFRNRFFAARASYHAHSPDDLAFAYSRWAAGDFVGPEGFLRSLASDARHADPGFAARVSPVERPEVALPGGATLRSGQTVDATVQARRELIQARQELQAELLRPETSAARRMEIDDLDRSLRARINAHSERLGDAAGRRWAGLQPGGLVEVPLSRTGAGLPDQVYEGPNGRLILVETKGGDSRLGVRRSADGTRLVEQGTREYLESLGTTMAASTDPAVARLGNRILAEMKQPTPNLDYVLVVQPVNADGSLGAPRVGQFDLSRSSPGRPPGGTSAPPTAAAPAAAGETALPGAPQPTGGISGTAAAVEGTAFRGNALPEPRVTAAAEAAALLAPHAASNLLARDPATAAFTRTAPASDGRPGAPHLDLDTISGGRVRVRVEVVADIEARLPAEASRNGVPVAGFHQTAAGEYTIFLSSRAPEGAFERALTHELAEIRHAHEAGEIPDALRPGGFGSPGAPARTHPRLSPHDMGRLAEIDVLARQIEAAHAAGDHAQVARLRDESQRLLAHLGLVDNNQPSQLRREAALAALTDRPGARRLLTAEAQAAGDNPFLRLPPADPRGYLDHLLDRLEYARTLGDAERQAQVLEQARSRMVFRDKQVVSFVGPDGERVAYSVRWVEQRAAAGDAPRTRLLQEMIDHARINRQPQRNPAEIDPDYAAAVRRIFADEPLFRDWQDFRRRFGMPATAPLAEQLILFAEWARGKYVTDRGRLASLAAAARRSEVLPYFEHRATSRPEFRPISVEDQHLALARTGRSVEQWLEERRNLIANRRQLEQALAQTTDPDQRRVIQQQLNDLRGRDITRSSEMVGEAAAIRFAVRELGIPAGDLTIANAAGLPDIIHRDPATGRVRVIEAKGGESEPTGRLFEINNRTRRVQQGTREYLQSLAQEMQGPAKPAHIQQLGRELEAAILSNQVDYYLVRQPFTRDGGLGTPTVIKFDVTRGGRIL